MMILVGFFPLKPAFLTARLLLMLIFLDSGLVRVNRRNSVLITSRSRGNRLTGLDSRSYLGEERLDKEKHFLRREETSYQFSVNSRQPSPS